MWRVPRHRPPGSGKTGSGTCIWVAWAVRAATPSPDLPGKLFVVLTRNLLDHPSGRRHGGLAIGPGPGKAVPTRRARERGKKQGRGSRMLTHVIMSPLHRQAPEMKVRQCTILPSSSVLFRSVVRQCSEYGMKSHTFGSPGDHSLTMLSWPVANNLSYNLTYKPNLRQERTSDLETYLV